MKTKHKIKESTIFSSLQQLSQTNILLLDPKLPSRLIATRSHVLSLSVGYVTKKRLLGFRRQSNIGELFRSHLKGRTRIFLERERRITSPKKWTVLPLEMVTE